MPGGQTQESFVYADITATQLLERLDRGAEPFIIDIREPEEFAEWAIPGAVNVPLGQVAARGRELTRDREIVVVCASGKRSSQAAMALARAGMAVANLKGGMLGWGTVYDTAAATVGDATGHPGPPPGQGLLVLHRRVRHAGVRDRSRHRHRPLHPLGR